MARSVFSRRQNLPGISPDKEQLEFFDFSSGLNTFWANDVKPDESLSYVTDARISTLGRYQTRKGLERFSDPIGESSVYTQDSTASESDEEFNETQWVADKFSPSATGRLSKAEVRIRKPSGATGTVIIKVHEDDGGEPGEVIAESSLAQSDISSSFEYHSCFFIQTPQIDSTNDYWLSASVQPTASNEYAFSSSTDASTALQSTDTGVSWSSTSVTLNMKIHTSDDGAVLGLHRTRRTDGARRTLFAHGTSVYKVDETDGSTTEIKSGLSSNAEKYRFETVGDVTYYVNDKDAPRKYDLSTDTESEVGGNPAVASTLIEHKGLIFYVESDDPTKLFFSDFGDYEVFESTSFIYVPAPNKADPITALQKLNDNLVVFTRNSKYIISGSDKSTFQLRQAPGQKGTYSQETTQADRNYIYYLSDDGEYKFNGTSDELLSQEVTDIVREITSVNPEDAATALTNNRFYVFYTPTGDSRNSKCLVYNINHESFESEDLNAFISVTDVLLGSNRDFIQASNSIGGLYKAEASENDYNNLGAPLEFELRTRYHHFDSPGQKKMLRKWQPRFAAQSGQYDVTCQVDRDFRNAPDNHTISVSADGPEFGDGETFGSGVEFGSTSLVNSGVYPNGSSPYIQLRYKHTSARQPLEFEGHTLEMHTRRLR